MGAREGATGRSDLGFPPGLIGVGARVGARIGARVGARVGERVGGRVERSAVGAGVVELVSNKITTPW